jgi:hypothetical protein
MTPLPAWTLMAKAKALPAAGITLAAATGWHVNS